MSQTAREVVADYLKAKHETDRPNRQRAIVSDYTRDIVDELPDGFTIKDVRVCVGLLADDDDTLTGFTTGRRNRAVQKTLDELVADGFIVLNERDEYEHKGL